MTSTKSNKPSAFVLNTVEKFKNYYQCVNFEEITEKLMANESLAKAIMKATFPAKGSWGLSGVKKIVDIGEQSGYNLEFCTYSSESGRTEYSISYQYKNSYLAFVGTSRLTTAAYAKESAKLEALACILSKR